MPFAKDNRRMTLVRRDLKANSGESGITLAINETGAHVVAAVDPGAAGFAVGIRKGDIVTAINDTATIGLSQGQVNKLLRRAGSQVRLQLDRDGTTQTVSGMQGGEEGEEEEPIGVTLATGGVFKHGTAVLSVTPGSPADRAGVEAGDILSAVNGISLEGASHTQVLDALKRAQNAGEELALKLQRGNEKVNARTTSAMVLELGIVVELQKSGLIQVVELFKNGVSEARGIKRGDVLLSVDGKSLLKPKSFKSAIKFLRSADPTATQIVAAAVRSIDFSETLQNSDASLTKIGASSVVRPTHTILLKRRIDPRSGNLESMGFTLGSDNIKGSIHTAHSILDCKVGSIAEREGLKIGDTLVSINGTDVNEMSHENIKVLLRSAGAQLELAIVRPINQTVVEPEAHILDNSDNLHTVTENFVELSF